MSNLHVVKDGPSNIGDDPTAGRFSYVRGRIHDHADGATIRRDRFEVKASAKRGSGRGPTNDTGKERKEEDRPESTTTATRRSELAAHKRRSAPRVVTADCSDSGLLRKHPLSLPPALLVGIPSHNGKKHAIALPHF